MAHRRILLVEGSDDEHVVKHICGGHGIPELDEIKPLGSDSELLDSIPVQIKASEDGDIVGVIIDADTNMQGRWDSIRDRIDQFGYDSPPDQPSREGTILNSPERTLYPRLGIWIMPDNRTNGILEDFLHFLIPQPNQLLDHVVRSVDNIPEQELRFRKPDDVPKAVIHTWLAWQQEPGRPYGTAITARFLDADVPEAHVLVSWLRRLFHPET